MNSFLIITPSFQLRKMTADAKEMFEDLKSKFKAKERSLTWMCITIITVFVVCHSFYSIYYILKNLNMLNHFGSQYIHSTARIFAIINSSANILIYLVFNNKFRKTFISIFTKFSFEIDDTSTEKEKTANTSRT